MTIVNDSYLRIILPEDISNRIAEFMNGRQIFPFIEDSELICIFYLYGKNNSLDNDNGTELKRALNLAERTVTKMSKDIEVYKTNVDSKLNSESIRTKYINRGLQITVDKRLSATTEQIVNDPAILSDCFAQHIAFYHHEYFFQIYGPFAKQHLIKDIQNSLIGRMVMLGFNRKNEESLPFKHPLIPLYIWLRENNWNNRNQ